MIEKTNVTRFAVPSCDVEMSFNSFIIKDQATGDRIEINSIDWRKYQSAMAFIYRHHISNETGIQWFKDSASSWSLDDLESLEAAVKGAIVTAKASAKLDSLA